MTTKPTHADFTDEKEYKKAYNMLWRQTHRERDNEIKRNWARENKDYYSCYFRSVESVSCLCGGHHKPKDIKKHNKTKRHQRYLEQVSEVSTAIELV